MSVARVSFEHVLRLTDDVGIFEHADGSVPRRHLGLLPRRCRPSALVVVARQPDQTPALGELRHRYLDFVDPCAGRPTGAATTGSPRPTVEDEAGVEDCWGRALWGLGTAAGRGRRRTASASSRWRRSMSARDGVPRAPPGDGLRRARRGGGPPRGHDDHAAARAARRRRRGRSGDPTGSAVVAVAGTAPDLRQRGVPRGAPRRRRAPRRRAALSTTGCSCSAGSSTSRRVDGHLSVTPVGGWATGEPRPGFDQQPIEVAALADACARACATHRRRAVGRGRGRGGRLVPRRQRRRDSAVRPDDRRRLRRSARRRSQREPGRRVDAGDDLHPPARPPARDASR